MKRRQVLGGVDGMAALAGCFGSARDVPVAGDRRRCPRGVGATRRTERRVRGLLPGIDAISVHKRTYTYDFTALCESIAEFSRGEVDRSLACFVASRMTLERIGRRFATPERLVDAMRGVESGFRAREIESVERVAPVDQLPAVDDELVEYRGLTPLPPFSREVSASGVSTTVEFSGRPLDMEGVFVVWKSAVDMAYVAGGVFPPEDALETLAPGVSGVDLATVLDLGFDPRRCVRRSSDSWRRPDEGATDF